MVNVVEMIERENQVMVSEYPFNRDNHIYCYFGKKKLLFTLIPEIAVVYICPPRP
jgi:hypothetical protein